MTSPSTTWTQQRLNDLRMIAASLLAAHSLSVDQADDMVQIVALKLEQRSQNPNGRKPVNLQDWDSIRSLRYRMLLNEVINLLRSKRSRRETLASPEISAAVPPVAPDVAVDPDRHQRVARREEQLMHVREAVIGRVGERNWAVFYLFAYARVVDGIKYTIQDVAESIAEDFSDEPLAAPKDVYIITHDVKKKFKEELKHQGLTADDLDGSSILSAFRNVMKPEGN